MRSFWTSGYDGASIDTMCRVTGMSRASLYQAYGGKEGLFLAAIAHDVETRMSPVVDALGPTGTLAEDLAAFFDEVLALATADPQTPGCLVSCVLADAAGSSDGFRAELARRWPPMPSPVSPRRRRAASCCAPGRGRTATSWNAPPQPRCWPCFDCRPDSAAGHPSQSPSTGPRTPPAAPRPGLESPVNKS